MFKIKKSSDGQYYVVLVAKNGQVLMTSETYTRKENAIHCVTVIHEILPNMGEVRDETNE